MIVFGCIILAFFHGILTYWDYRERRLPTVWMIFCLILGALLGTFLNPTSFWIGSVVYGGLFAVIWGIGQHIIPRGPLLGFGDVLLVLSMGPLLSLQDLWLFCILSGLLLGLQWTIYRSVLQPLAPPIIISFWVCFLKSNFSFFM